MKICCRCGISKPVDAFGRHKARSDGLSSQCRECRNTVKRQLYKNPLVKEKARRDLKDKHKRSPEYKMVHRAKRKSMHKNIPFDLSANDIHIPAVCPVLGIPIFVGSGIFCDNSPSLDRRVPSIGYVRGNVEVISYRANRIKNDAILEELEKLVEWLKDRNGRAD